jgi:hypothetical protein
MSRPPTKRVAVRIPVEWYEQMRERCTEERDMSDVIRGFISECLGIGTVPYPDVPTRGDGKPYFADEPLPTRMGDIGEVRGTYYSDPDEDVPHDQIEQQSPRRRK